MIVKILTRHTPTYKSLMQYIVKGAEESKDMPQILTHNLRSNDLIGLEKEYVENEAYRKHTRQNQSYLFHEILSFHSNEAENLISDEILKDIFYKYISLRGMDGVYLAASHRNKNHVHLHICTSSLKYRIGTALRLSKTDLQNLKINLQAYHKERYPEITQSFPNHGNNKEYVSNQEWQLKQRDSRTSIKANIKDILLNYSTKAKSQTEFLELLKDSGLPYYLRNGVPTGVIYEGLKFRFSRFDLLKDHFKKISKGTLKTTNALTQIQNIRKKNIQHLKEHQIELNND